MRTGGQGNGDGRRHGAYPPPINRRAEDTDESAGTDMTPSGAGDMDDIPRSAYALSVITLCHIKSSQTADIPRNLEVSTAPGGGGMATCRCARWASNRDWRRWPERIWAGNSA